MTTVAHPPSQGYRTIRFPLSEHEYERLLSDRTSAKARLQELYEDSPAWFPAAFPGGYALCGFTDPSGKHPRRCRRLRLDATHEVFTVAPAFVMRYAEHWLENLLISGSMNGVESAPKLSPWVNRPVARRAISGIQWPLRPSTFIARCADERTSSPPL